MSNYKLDVNLDIEALKDQKNALVLLRDHCESFSDELAGLLGLVDSIQDRIS